MIDKNRLKEMAEDFGAEEVPSLVEMFLDETWEALDQLGSQLESDPGVIGPDLFHFLKGCGRNIGATEFASMCEVFEKGEQPFTPAEYQTLRSAFQAVTDFFRGEGARLIA